MGLNHDHDPNKTKHFEYAEEITDRYMRGDGLISYYVSSPKTFGEDPVDQIFDRLEQETGIRHERVFDPALAEVDIAWESDPLIFGGGEFQGFCVWKQVGTTDVVVDETYEHFYGVMVHEIGHALGLGHDHEKTGSIMSYFRDPRQTWFNYQDLSSIIEIFEEWIPEPIEMVPVAAPTQEPELTSPSPNDYTKVTKPRNQINSFYDDYEHLD